MSDWWEGFFDEDYLRLWGPSLSDERTEREADGLMALLRLAPGAKVLDAPCGFGRLSRSLAGRGVRVLGVDLSATHLARAERDRGEVPVETLRLLRHDLRTPLPERDFDAAFNVFSSIGYGTEEDDVAVFRATLDALKPGGLFVVETMHRDMVAAAQSRGARPCGRFADGTLLLEEPKLDSVTGRVETCWYWWGPSGAGRKPASMRMYTATELVALLQRAGFTFLSAHAGLSTAPFVSGGPEMGGRIAILAARQVG